MRARNIKERKKEKKNIKEKIFYCVTRTLCDGNDFNVKKKE